MNENAAPPTETVLLPDSAVVSRGEETPTGAKRPLWLLDFLIFLVLVGAALPLRLAATTGDLWADEADYALASTKGFAANRWDRRDNPEAQKALIASRHFHAPLTVYVVGLARYRGSTDRALRTPFAVAGGLTVGLTYLCGLSLFGARREIGIGCALIVLVTPLEIRFLSHVVPWSLITPCLMTLLWTVLNFASSRRPGWLIATGATLGLLFTLSEMVFPTLVVTALALTALLWNDCRDAAKRKPILQAGAAGLAAGLAIILILWPAGLLGDALTMVNHYVGVSQHEIPMTIAGKRYNSTPKWAYFYYYWHDFKPYLVLYLSGMAAITLLAALRKLSRPAFVLLLFTVFFLAVAHRAHILGPQYLVHCLPLLTLLCGLAVLQISTWNRVVGGLVFALVVGYLFHWKPRREALDSEVRAAVPRWPAAAQFLKSRWQPDDTMLIGPQPQVVARWYLQRVAQMPIADAQVLMLPQYLPKPKVLQSIANGDCRFIIVSSTFAGSLTFDSQIRQMLGKWPLVYKSDEGADRAPRLLIYERPTGQNAQHPQPIPPPGKVGPPPLEEDNRQD